MPERPRLLVVAEYRKHVEMLMRVHGMREHVDWWYVYSNEQLQGMHNCVLWVYRTARRRPDYSYLMDLARAMQLPVIYIDD